MRWVIYIFLIVCGIIGFFYVWSMFGDGVAGILGIIGVGGGYAVKGVKKRAEKKHLRIADDPDAVQRDNLNRLRRRNKKRSS